MGKESFMRSFGLAGIVGGFLLLAGCVPDPVLMGADALDPPGPVAAASAYVARADGTFTIPAVPIEKVPPEFQRQTVRIETDQPVGTIIINPAARHLYLVTGPNLALRYGISVGRAGFEWSGEAIVSGRRSWPTWTPPPEMIARDPKLARWEKGQPGGPTNPLGARALYLTTNGVDYGYRIHGTPEWQSIGRNASSGCIRMINQDVIDLYTRVQDGAKVIVLTRDGTMPTRLSLPPPAPPKPAAPVAAAAPAPSPAVPAAALPDVPVAGPV
jgi:lipoprotein-anchoring transpeptidase ErfK/SrfK